MSRVTLPIAVPEWITLFGKTKAKHDADGAGSVLNPYIAEEAIDMSADESAVNDADSANTKFLLYEKQSEEATEQRDHLFNPVFDDHRKCVQFLKKLYRSNVHKLGEWGVTVNGDGLIVYPVDFAEKVTAITNFITQHSSYTAPTSPLQPFLDENNIDLAANQSDLDDSSTANDLSITKNADKEERLEMRDELLDPVKDHLRGIGQFLVGLYPDTPHKAGNWGFAIDSSPQADVIRTFSISAGDVRTLKDVAMNSDLLNKGSVTIYIKPHNHPDATPVALEAGKKFKVVRGYGKMDIDNSTGASDASVQATLNK